MRTPKAEKEDPAVAERRAREELRAEASRTAETQAMLVGATARRNRRVGTLGQGGSVPLISAAGGTGAGTPGSGNNQMVTGRQSRRFDPTTFDAPQIELY